MRRGDGRGLGAYAGIARAMDNRGLFAFGWFWLWRGGGCAGVAANGDRRLCGAAQATNHGNIISELERAIWLDGA